MSERESAALICRVSTREQEDGYSLDAQERFLEEACEKREFVSKLTHRFSETASKHDQRKKFKLFMSEVARQNIRHILVEKVDRLTRGGLKEATIIDDWLEADERRHLHCVKDGIDLHKFSRSGEKLNWGMRVVLAKNYSDNLREEVLKTADEMLRRGIWPTKAPIGYVRDKAQQSSPIQPDPEKSALIAEMFRLYDSGDWSVNRLSLEIHELGLVNSNGHQIMPSRIHKLLQDPFYIGKMKFRGKVWPAAHEPIIGLDLFERVQARLKRKLSGKGAAHYQKHAHILSGLAVCGGCNKRINWELQKGATYGYCKRYGYCPKRAIKPESATEAALLPQLKALKVINPRIADWIYRALEAGSAEDASLKENRVKQLQEDLRLVSQKIDRLLELRIEGEITKEEFDAKRSSYSEDKSRLENQIRMLGRNAYTEAIDAAELFRSAQEASTEYPGLLPAERRRILLKFFSVVRISGSDVTSEYAWPYKQFAQAVELTNRSKISESRLPSNPNFELAKSGSANKKDPRLQVSHPSWLAAWNKFRRELPDQKATEGFVLEESKTSACPLKASHGLRRQALSWSTPSLVVSEPVIR